MIGRSRDHDITIAFFLDTSSVECVAYWRRISKMKNGWKNFFPMDGKAKEEKLASKLIKNLSNPREKLKKKTDLIFR